MRSAYYACRHARTHARTDTYAVRITHAHTEAGDQAWSFLLPETRPVERIYDSRVVDGVRINWIESVQCIVPIE